MFPTLGRLETGGPPQLDYRPQRLGQLPDGVAGIKATGRRLAAWCKEYTGHPAILQTARELVAHLPEKAYIAEARTLFEFVRDTIRYVQDPEGIELVTAPDLLLIYRQGDCDDKALLLASLLRSIGHPVRFIIAGYDAPGAYEHVYVETLIGERYIPCETIPLPCGSKAPFGFAMPGVVARLEFYPR